MKLRDTHSAADRIGVGFNTLEKWRVKGEGPPFIRVGRLVKYSDEDVDQWLASRRTTSTSEAA